MEITGKQIANILKELNTAEQPYQIHEITQERNKETLYDLTAAVNAIVNLKTRTAVHEATEKLKRENRMRIYKAMDGLQEIVDSLQ